MENFDEPEVRETVVGGANSGPRVGGNGSDRSVESSIDSAKVSDSDAERESLARRGREVAARERQIERLRFGNSFFGQLGVDHPSVPTRSNPFSFEGGIQPSDFWVNNTPLGKRY